LASALEDFAVTITEKNDDVEKIPSTGGASHLRHTIDGRVLKVKIHCVAGSFTKLYEPLKNEE